MAQDAQQVPTWGQHGANMGPTWGPKKAPKSVQGAKNLVPTGSGARTPAKSRHGPQIDPKMDPKRTPICFQNGPTLIPNGAKIDSTSTINPFQISSKIDLEIHFMLTILKSTSPPGRQAQEALSSSLWCLFFWSQVFRLFR